MTFVGGWAKPSQWLSLQDTELLAYNLEALIPKQDEENRISYL
jgi:hypothetical protein